MVTEVKFLQTLKKTLTHLQYYLDQRFKELLGRGSTNDQLLSYINIFNTSLKNKYDEALPD